MDNEYSERSLSSVCRTTVALNDSSWGLWAGHLKDYLSAKTDGLKWGPKMICVKWLMIVLDGQRFSRNRIGKYVTRRSGKRDGMGREEGGGFRMGNTCIPVADSFWYLAKLIQFVKFKNKIKKKKENIVKLKKKKKREIGRQISLKQAQSEKINESHVNNFFSREES